jgi:hypothetical protein
MECSRKKTLCLSWKDGSFGEVTVHNCLAYFSRSPFVRSGTIRNNKLEGKDGVEYVLQDVQPPHLFVIRMQSAKEGQLPLGLFYVLEGTVYASPSMHDVLSSRQARCSYRIRGSLEILREDLNPIEGSLSREHVDMSALLGRLEEAMEEREDREFHGDSIMYHVSRGRDNVTI